MAEALAGNMSIKSILPYCVKPVILENDCTTVIRSLQNKVPDKSIITVVVSEMQDLLKLTPGSTFSKVNRANNSVARELAKFGFCNQGWVLILPEWLD